MSRAYEYWKEQQLEPDLTLHHEGYPCHSNRIVEQLQEEEQWWQEARKRLKEWAKTGEYEMERRGE